MQSEKTKIFIEKARTKHGDRYNYERVEYVNAKTKIIISCKEHGEFSQTPSDHLSGCGCMECGGRMKPTTPLFLKKAKERHGDRYDYSLVDYVRNKTKVKIVCKEHGVFEQTPTHHLSGKGCPGCWGNRRRLSLDRFIERSIENHKDKYDYSLVEYTNNSTKVTILCKTHGAFQQKPRCHMEGKGCPRCAFDRGQPAYVYIMKSKDIVKIGVSVDPKKRHAQQKKSQPFNSSIIYKKKTNTFTDALSIEKSAHEKLSPFNANLTGFDGSTEWFNVSAEKAIYSVENSFKELIKC